MLRVSLHGEIPDSRQQGSDNSWPRDYVARIVPGAGVPAYLVDLTEFAEGREITKGGWQRSSITEAFRGRPRLARQLAETFQARYWPSSKATAQRIGTDLREFFRFLDSCDDRHMPVECLEDLGNAHATGFKLWRDTTERGDRVGGLVRPLLVAALELFNLEPLFWPSLQ